MKWPERINFSTSLVDVRLKGVLQAPVSLPPVDWEKKAREREELAYERGRQDGEKGLSEQLLRQRTELMELHQGVIHSLQEALPKTIQQLENDLVQVALEAATKLVAGLPISAEMVEAAVRDAMEQVKECTEFFVYLNARDLELLKDAKSPLLDPQPSGDKVHFHVSAEVNCGGCLIQTRFGTIDARRETKIEQLQKALGI